MSDEDNYTPHGENGENGENGHNPTQGDSTRYRRDSEGYAPRDEDLALGDDLEVPGIPVGAEAILPSRLAEVFDDDAYDAWGFPRAGARHADLDPESGWMPDEELVAAAAGSDSLDGSRKEWQVNVRLDYAQYAALGAAASLYGARPTTFARMLINRGAQATLAAHRAEFVRDPTD